MFRRRVGRYETLVSDLISSLPWSCSRLYVADNDDSGGDNNLFVTVSEYDPFLWSDNVRCFGSTGGPEILESCTGLADRMDASESSKTFGPQGLPHDYLTPYTLTAGKNPTVYRMFREVTVGSIDNRCYLKITTYPNNRYTRTASWYELWEAAILINAMCIRHGKKGVFSLQSLGAPFIIALEI